MKSLPTRDTNYRVMCLNLKVLQGLLRCKLRDIINLQCGLRMLNGGICCLIVPVLSPLSVLRTGAPSGAPMQESIGVGGDTRKGPHSDLWGRACPRLGPGRDAVWPCVGENSTLVPLFIGTQLFI